MSVTCTRCTSASGATTRDCEAIVAVGGGSAIDTAKALMVGTASGRFEELIGIAYEGRAVQSAPREDVDRSADDRRNR